MHTPVDWKKVFRYLLLAFGISWSVAATMKWLGIPYGSVASVFIVAGLYMPGPAIAAFVLNRFWYKQSFKTYGWRFERSAVRWLLLTPLLLSGLLLLAFAVVALLGNTGVIPQFGQVDFSPAGFGVRFSRLLREQVGEQVVPLPVLPPAVMFAVFILQGLVAGATVNIPSSFGEEFGWRGLLLKETQPLGFFAANLVVGIAWGLWHLPIILMGHNYPHHPYLGIVMMCLFTTGVSPLFAYVRLKSGTIAGPCLLHGMLNATGGIFALFIARYNELLGSVAGWAGIIAGTLMSLGIYVFDRPFAKAFKRESE